MQQTVIAQNQDHNDRFVLGIVVEHESPCLDPIAAIQAAAAEFCQTENGERVLKHNNGYFNYGDFVDSVPEEICEKHGFRVVNTFVTDLIVDHDDQLRPEN